MAPWWGVTHAGQLCDQDTQIEVFIQYEVSCS